MNDSLATLLEQQAVWRCRQSADGLGAAATLSTGYRALDRYLPGGGWPLNSLVEVLSGAAGIGELRLVMPALAELAATREGAIVWVGAPYQPYAPALAQWGLDVSRVLVIQPPGPEETLWAIGEALASGGALAVLGWLTDVDIRASRRLQLAASEGQSLGILYRPALARQQPSAAVLRLALKSGSTGPEVDIFKVRGAPAGRVFGYEEYRGHWPVLAGDAAVGLNTACGSG